MNFCSLDNSSKNHQVILFYFLQAILVKKFMSPLDYPIFKERIIKRFLLFFLYIKIRWPPDCPLLKEKSFFHVKRTIGWRPNFPQCLVPKKKIEILFCKGKLGGRSIFMFFKEKENQVATQFSCSFRKRRIRWSFDFFAFLEKGNPSNHQIFLTTPKKT